MDAPTRFLRIAVTNPARPASLGTCIPQLLTGPRVAEIAEQILLRGAVIVGPQLSPTLVGDLRWAGPNHLLWFPAFGDRADDAQLFTFHEARLTRHHGVVFRAAGGGELTLTPIDRADVADPDDFRVAWQLWQHVVPLRRELIERAYAQIASPFDCLATVEACAAGRLHTPANAAVPETTTA